MFSYGNIQLKVCGITDIRSLELIQKYSVSRVGFVSDHLHGPNTLSVHEIIKLKNKSYELKLNPILLIGNLEITEIIKVIKKIGIKEVCLANQYTYEEIQQLIKSTDIKISISVNFNNHNCDFFQKIKNVISSFYYDLNIYHKDKIEKKELSECITQIDELKQFSKPLYLGGGINIENIKEAINTLSPFGVDISSGLKKSNTVDEEKLKKILDSLVFDEIA